eukprot:gnl/Hemi2/10971_TR3761_c0_g2_i1.p2 gnl/Hemi2/10971_TR3761_c0_g2~~gnl/Hemi2/10971_TR3761_c0_g2_i1.p2  ORF type:complete len:108 (-),score=33.05 gnl/Hemi2/10971_TR3761_c0_g2_i1:70-393(-)
MTDAAGGEYDVCQFADGRVCQEWAFFRKECDKSTAVCLSSYLQSHAGHAVHMQPRHTASGTQVLPCTATTAPGSGPSIPPAPSADEESHGLLDRMRAWWSHFRDLFH